MQLNQKECSLLRELKEQERVCIEKYTRGAAAAVDGQLKGLFTHLAELERQHLNTLGQIETGTPPAVPGGGQPQETSFTAVYAAAETPDKKNDSYLCADALSGEKHVSSLYDTCVFEFRDAAARNALNHIQKEEQEHGKMIYQYMAANAMYG